MHNDVTSLDAARNFGLSSHRLKNGGETISKFFRRRLTTKTKDQKRLRVHVSPLCCCTVGAICKLIPINHLSHFQTSVNRCEKLPCPSSSINCCLTSSPCFNGGSCVPTIGSNNIQRYTCKCPPYYHGYRCEIPIKSCKDVATARASNFPSSPGKYAILDHNSNPFDVFCDFENITLQYGRGHLFNLTHFARKQIFFGNRFKEIHQ